MAIIIAQNADNLEKLIGLIDAAIKDPKGWKAASTEISNAVETIKQANEVAELISKLDAAKAEADKSSAKAEAATIKAETAKTEAAEAEKVAKDAIAENTALLAVIANKENALADKESQLIKLQEKASTDIAEAKAQIDLAKTKQAELDEQIAKYKTALANLQAASV